MPYYPNTPLSTEDPSDTQPKLLANFSAINTQFAVNHVAMTAGLNNGFHTKVFFPQPLVANPNLAAPLSSLYTKNSTSTYTGTTPELFFQNGALASDVKQLTNIPLVTTTVGATGFGFKSPWGLTFNFGFVPTPSNTGTDSLTFQVPFNNIIYYLDVTAVTVISAPYVVSTNNTTTMTYSGYTNGASYSGIYFLAIGLST